MHRLLSITCMLQLAGCLLEGDGHPGFATLMLTDDPPLKIRAQPGSLNLTFATGEYSAPCGVLPGTFRAAVNGVEMSVTRGSASDYGLDSPDWVCTEPSAALRVSPETATLELSDGSTTRSIDLGNLLAPRIVTPIGSNEWTRGNTYDVAWTPAADLAAGRPNDAALSRSTAENELTLSSDGTTVSVTMPAAATFLYQGEADVRFTWSTTSTPCSNCTLTGSGSVSVPVIVR